MSMEEENELKTESRLTALETKVDTITTNHLPHLQMAIDDVGKQVKKLYSLLWGIMITLLAGLLGIIAAILALGKGT